jgi:ribosomal protein S18 acetylase RimI-like enzyme
MDPVCNTIGETILHNGVYIASAAQSFILTDIALAAKAYWGYDADFIEACRAELTVTPEQITHKENLCLVKSIDGELCGFVLVKPITDTVAGLESLFIRPDHIGYGHGTELLTIAKRLAKERGYKKLVIESDPNAVGFYEKMGAVKTGEIPSGSIASRSLPCYELIL